MKAGRGTLRRLLLGTGFLRPGALGCRHLCFPFHRTLLGYQDALERPHRITGSDWVRHVAAALLHELWKNYCLPRPRSTSSASFRRKEIGLGRHHLRAETAPPLAVISAYRPSCPHPNCSPLNPARLPSATPLFPCRLCLADPGSCLAAARAAALSRHELCPLDGQQF